MIRISLKNKKSIVSADRWINNKGLRVTDYGLLKYLANFIFVIT